MKLQAQIRPALVALLVFVLLTGVIYPLSITGLAQLFFPHQANGSLLSNEGQTVGSELVGQQFSAPRYFWPRPSATAGHPYNAFDPSALTGSSGSNLGPLSSTLVDTVRQRVEALQAANPDSTSPIPVDLVTASASGLDAHISPAAAYYQIARIARVRGLNPQVLSDLVDQHIENRQLGFLGQARVNVLLLNLALDGIK